jgi:hypothetical protein
MVVPRPPLSLSTASLSSSFLVASRSAFHISGRMFAFPSIRFRDMLIIAEEEEEQQHGFSSGLNVCLMQSAPTTFRRGLEGVVRHHHLVGGRADLGPLDALLVAAAGSSSLPPVKKHRCGQRTDAETG